MRALFVCILVPWVYVVLVHLLRYGSRGHMGSIRVSFYPLGWPLFIASLLRWITPREAPAFLAMALALGLFSAVHATLEIIDRRRLR